MFIFRCSRIWWFILVLVILSLETACGGGGSGYTSAGAAGIIDGVATKGPLSNATVKAYGIANGQTGAEIGSAMTDSNGNYSMTIAAYAGPVMLRVSGGSYTDEATGLTVTMASGDVMTAVMQSVGPGATISGIQITPITSMAQARAQQMQGGMTDSNIAAANQALCDYFLVRDILHVAPMNPRVPGSGVGASADARNYGMALAAMSQYAYSLNLANPSALVTAMMSDASDGMMDGQGPGGQIRMSMGGMMGGTTMMPSTGGRSALATAMTSFMANTSSANMSGLTAADVPALVQKLTNTGGTF